jgi:peptidoglycan/xylan/chitin deacetylase (PgdA/CDA1 family)
MPRTGGSMMLPAWKLKARKLWWRGWSVQRIAARMGISTAKVEAALLNMSRNQLMIKHHFNKESASRNLWMSNENIQELHRSGHIIGLHSYSHPTTLHTLTMKEQELEYEKNFDHLSSILNDKPIAMSHPCGNYNEDTLKILNKFGIRIGFRS